MPAGTPSTEELTSRIVGAFSLDTSVVQAAAFSFSRGSLAGLSEQLPPWMQLWLSDIVAREIMRHRLDGVRRAVLQVNGGYSDLRRFLLDADLQFPEDAEQYVSAAISHFDEQLQIFVQAHNGTILEAQGPQLSADLFKRYFSQVAPFGGGRDKKHEFPDAASLLMLESHSRARGVKVIAVSADEGWKAFAKTSEDVYCVSSLRELTELFIATSSSMRAFAARASSMVMSKAFKDDVARLLAKQLPTLPWTVVAHAYGCQVDAGVVNAIVESFDVKENSLRLWNTSRDESVCVAHVAVELDARLEVEAYAYRQKYKSSEKDDLAHTSFVVPQGIELFLALEFFGVGPGVAAEDALSKVTILTEPIPVIVGRIRFPGIPETRWGFDDMNDDIPF